MHARAISAAHDPPSSGHLGVDKTYARLARDFYWPGCYRDVADYVRGCLVCQKVKPSQLGPAGLMGRRTPEKPWDIVSSDVMGPFPPTREQFCYLVVFQDTFTKWVEMKALRKANAKSIRSAFHERVLFR